MAFSFRIAGELPEEIRMMDSAYRRGVALQKMRMIQPLLQYLPEEDRIALLNSDQMKQLFQDAGIGQLPEFKQPERGMDWKTANQKLDFLTKLFNYQQLPNKARMDALREAQLKRNLAASGLKILDTKGGKVLYNILSGESTPITNTYTDRSGRTYVKFPSGKVQVVQEPRDIFTKTPQGGFFINPSDRSVNPAYLNTSTDTWAGMSTPGGDKIAGRSVPYYEQVNDYLQRLKDTSALLRDLGAPGNTITNTLEQLYGIGTRRAFPKFWRRVLDFGRGINPSENMTRADIFRRARQLPRGETTNRPMPFTRPQYPKGYDFGPAIPSNWGTPPVLNPNTTNKNYRIPVRF